MYSYKFYKHKYGITSTSIPRNDQKKPRACTTIDTAAHSCTTHHALGLLSALHYSIYAPAA